MFLEDFCKGFLTGEEFLEGFLWKGLLNCGGFEGKKTFFQRGRLLLFAPQSRRPLGMWLIQPLCVQHLV